MRVLIVLVLLFLKGLQVQSAVSFSVLIGDSTINALTNYTWKLSFPQTNSRSWMAFTFPSACILASNSVSYIGNTAYPIISFYSNFMNISTTGLAIASFIDVVITNVTNPFSSLTLVSDFWFSSDLDSSIRIQSGAEIYYNSGIVTCGWSFNQCTEQANSQLTITLNTSNFIPANQQATFVVGFPSVWSNQNLKSLFWGGSTLICSLDINGAGTITAGVVCTNTSSTITVTYTPNVQINGSSQVLIYVRGVMSPPTQTTPADTQYTATIKDSSGFVIDDVAGSSCTIAPVCVTNFTNGLISPSPLTINTTVTALTTLFNVFPSITFMRSDTVSLTYSQSATISSCTLFRVTRNNNTYTLVNNISGATVSYNFPSSGSAASNLPDYNYGFPISILMQCSSFVTPLSETPATFTFTFRRNNAEYMQLSGTFSAVATTFNSSNGLLTLSNNQMASTGVTYTFTFTTGQALGPNPQFFLTFASDISLSGATCMIGVNSSASNIDCTPTSLNLVINYSSGTIIPSGSNIIIRVLGITNPLLPTAYNFGLTTYYSSSVNTSKVESNSAAFTTTYTAITNLPVVLTPSNFTVYTSTPINMTFTCPTNIPELSTFTLTFPTQVTQLTSSAQMLSVSSTIALLNSTPISSGSTVTFVNLQTIPIASSVVISMTIRSPTYVSLFPSIQLTASQNGSTLFQSSSSMPINVTIPGVMPVSITPQYPLTGANSPYLITITLTIPHPDPFTLDVSAPTDTSFISSGASCTTACQNLLYSGSNGFTVTVNNPYPNSTSAVNIALNISSFNNSRNIGQGMPWTIMTRNTGNHIMSTQTASPTITVPNLLTGKLDQTQSYYRNNTNTVKVQLTLVNRLLSTDYVLFTMDRTTYDVFSNVNCSNFYGLCFLQTNKSTTNVLVIKVIPANILANPLEIWIQGLVSGLNTNYLQTNFITVGTYSSSRNLIDQGKIAYNISCRDSTTLSKNCRRCSGGNCIDCYITQGYYLSGNSCVTSCGDSTSYFSFANSTSGRCQSCSGTSSGCRTCINSTACLTCLNASFYLFPSTMTCSLVCPTSSGFVNSTLGGEPVCMPCADSNCFVCNNINYGSCNLCNNNSILISGICSSSCPGPSFYVLNANCIACDPSCYSCNGATNASCIRCAVNYYNYSGSCLQTCPNGTAKMLSTGSCGCASACLTCDSNNFASCLSCLNASQFVYNGQCVSTCPTASYQVNTSCLPCSSGCLNCTSTSCLACSSNWYIFGTQCYSDCNFISQQHDVSEIRCVLCPTGCDTCSSGSCTSCLTDYSLLSNSCVQTCLLTNSCSSDTSNVLPLPGCIAVFVWCGVIFLVHLFLHKNYIPYSMVLFSSVVQFILVIAVVSTSNAAVGRLLTYLQSSTKAIIIGLLAFTICINYITNFIYLYIFIKYLKPLIVNPKQMDIISHIAVLIVAMLTNYRFAIIAFAKLFPKPNIQIEMAKNLTPVHYLCMGSVILSIFPIIAAGVGLSKSQKLSSLFMLSMDLMILIIFNILITFWFIMSKKEDSYFENQLKKQYTSENMDNIDINMTKQNIMAGKNGKDASDVNMIMSMHDSQEKNSQQSDEYDFGQSYKKLKAKKTKITGKRDNNTILIRNNSLQSDPKISNQIDNNSQRIEQISKSPQRNIFAIDNQYQPQTAIKVEDVNFQQRVQKKGMTRLKDKMSRATTVNKSRPELLKNETPHRTIQFDQNKFQKQFFAKQIPQKKEQSDAASSADDHEIRFDQTKSHFSDLSMVSKIRKEIPKRDANNTNLGKNKNEMAKSMESKTVMKKNNSKRYEEANTSSKQQQESQKQDLAAIIKLKIQESSIRRSQNITVLSNQQNDLQEISPSYYNIQNQRFQIEDMENLEQENP